MNIQNSLPVFRLHFEQALVPQNARIVDQDVNLSEGINGRLDDVRPAVRRRNVVVIGNSLSSQGLDLINNFIRRSGRSLAGTVPGTAKIIDHYFCTPPG